MVVISTIVSKVIEATKDIPNIGLIDIIKLKPFPVDVLKVLENTENIIVIEEHSKSGGLGSIFNDVATAHGLSVRLNLIGFENKQLFEYGYFHADPHPGNMFALKGGNADYGNLAYVDFGMMDTITNSDRLTLIKAIVHIINEEYYFLN